MAIAYDPIIGHFQPNGEPWYSPLLDVSRQAEDSDFFFGSPLLVNKNSNVLLGFDNQQPHSQQQSPDSNVIFATSIEYSRQTLSGEDALVLDNQSITTTTNHKHLDDFLFENNFSAVQLDWQDQFVDLRNNGLTEWTFSTSPEGSSSGSCSPLQDNPPPVTPPSQSGRLINQRHHSSSSCSAPEDLAALVEVVDWACDAFLSPDHDHDHQAPLDQPPLYKDQQQVLDEIYRECEHQRSPSFVAHSQGQPDTEMRSAVDAFSVPEACPTPSLSSCDEEEEEEDGSVEVRKKTQNRRAASRYRSKRKQQRRLMQAERERMERENRRLHSQVQDAQREIDYLKSFLSEIRQKVVTVTV